MRIGIYGGSFSPPHFGHVAAATAFMEQMWLDLLYVIPTGIPPHKENDFGVNSWQRLKMCELAFGGLDGVVISDMEIRREGKSYAVDTVRMLRERCDAESRLFLLLGTDTFLSLGNWYGVDEIFRLCYPVYMRREEKDAVLDGQIVAKIEQYRERFGKVVRRIVGDSISVSSTEVRCAIKNGQDIRHMVPSSVADYIKDHNLYV